MTPIFKMKKKCERKNKQIYPFLGKWINIVIFFKQSCHHLLNPVLQKSKVHLSSNQRKKHFRNFLAKITSCEK